MDTEKPLTSTVAESLWLNPPPVPVTTVPRRDSQTGEPITAEKSHLLVSCRSKSLASAALVFGGKPPEW